MPVIVDDCFTDCSGLDDFLPDQPEVSDNKLVFSTPSLLGVAPIDVFSDCLAGTCTCVHMIGREPSQLKPCRAAQFLFGYAKLDSVTDTDAAFLWDGLVNVFSIVDDDCPASYECANYDSILEPKAFTEMSTLLESEILEHKVTKVEAKPTCVHSLGAVWKSNGKLRPITDCSRPDGASINNYMSGTFQSMAVVDISSA